MAAKKVSKNFIKPNVNPKGSGKELGNLKNNIKVSHNPDLGKLVK